MANIILATARAAGTGTGDTFLPYDLSGSSAEFRVDGSPFANSIRIKRTQPVPNKTFPGVFRGEITITEYVTDSLGVKWPMVYKVQSSVPAFVTIANSAAFTQKFGYVANDTWVVDALGRQLIPQA